MSNTTASSAAPAPVATPDAPPPQHPALLELDIERFRELAHVSTLRNGIRWLREHRVTHVEEQPDGVRAWFSAGAHENEPEAIVTVGLDEDGTLFVDGFDEETLPSNEEGWAYAVAAVFAYQAMHASSGEVMRGAIGRAMADRCERARQEVLFEHQSGDAPFGVYRASSVGIDRPGREGYLVHLRSLHHHINGCTCPDFQLSKLGMCKHTEAVRMAKARARRRFTKATVARLSDQEGASCWVLQIPRTLAEELRADGLVPVHAEELDAQDVAPVQEGKVDRSVIFLALAEETAALQPWLERWLEDPRFDIGHDVMLAVEHAQHDQHRRSRTLRWTRWFSDWDGQIEGLRCTPFPYQREGIEFLVRRGRALLADDMGLGKTMQAIAASSLMVAKGEVEKVLIVCPTSLLHQWRKEIERFTEHTVTVVEGGRAERVRRMRQPATFYVTTYDRLRLDFEVVASEVRPDLLVLDEAQRIKNWATRNAQYVSALQTPYAFVLTGTPLENKLEELFSLMQVVDPEILGPLWRFLRAFAILDLHGSPVSYRNLGALRDRLRPVLLRRERREVLTQLPPRTDTELSVELSRTQRALHDEAVEVAGRIAAILQRRPLSPSERHRLMMTLQRARMACNSAQLIDKSYDWRSPKLDTFAEMLQELCNDRDHKVVVFSEWIRMGELAGEIATSLGIGWVQLHGGVPSTQRGALIEAFETNPKVRLFISSDAGSTGLNLQSASVLIHLDCPWNPAILEQRSARIHRQGQKKPVQIIRLIAQHHYEGHVASLVENKRELFESVLGQESGDSLDMGGKRLDGLLEALESVTQPERSTATTQSSRSTVGVDVDDESSADANAPPESPDEAEDTPTPPPAVSNAQLETALAALDAGALGRDERLRLLGELLDALPQDAEVSVIEGRLVVATSEPDALERDLDLGAYAPLRIDVLTLSDRNAVVRYVQARKPDDVRTLTDLDTVRTAVATAPADHDPSLPTPPPQSPAADPRQTSARLLWDAGQPTLALSLLWSSRLDDIAATLGERAPAQDDAWRWLYTRALPSGAIDTDLAGALALAMSVSQDPAPSETRLQEAWRALQ